MLNLKHKSVPRKQLKTVQLKKKTFRMMTDCEGILLNKQHSGTIKMTSIDGYEMTALVHVL